MTKCKFLIKTAFDELGHIDDLHESGKITKSEHNRRSMKVLQKLIRC